MSWVLVQGVPIMRREPRGSATKQQRRAKKMRMEPESRVMRRLNGEQLKVIAGDGTIFKGAAQREITRRDRKSDKREAKGDGRK